jgi:hypothetical protein
MKSWTKPTPEQVDRVIGKLARPGANRYFFAKLQNPEWVEPLRAKGFFASPPPVSRDDEKGVIRIPDWPEADYLARVAAEVPELAAQIVLKMPETTNDRVHQSLAALALNLPPQLAARLIDKIVTWMPSSTLMTLSMRLPHLVSHLAEGGQSAEALRLAKEFFAFEEASGRDSGDSSFDWQPRAAAPKAGMDFWEYNEALKICMPSLARARPLLAIYLLADLLESALRGSDLVRTGERELDVSGARTSDLEAPDEAHPTSFEGLLARTLAWVAATVITEGGADADKVVYALEKRKWLLYRAITLHVLAGVAPMGTAEAKAKMLDRTLFEGPECKKQYVRLVRARFAELTADERKAVIEWITEGPDLEIWAKNYERIYGRPRKAEELEQDRKLWTRDRLSWLGVGNLPPDKAEELRQLVAELGEPEQEPFGNVSPWRPSSPKTDKELEAMPLPALVDLLRSWVPKEEGQASRAELGRQLLAAARSRPVEFSAAGDMFIGLAPIYVHHVIWGLDEAARLGAAFDVSGVLGLCGWMVEQPRGEEPDAPLRFGLDEKSWVGARRACASLIGTLLDRNLLPLESRGTVWTIIRELTEDPNPAPKDEREPGFDATTRSLNSIRGQAMHAVMKYGRWLWQAWDKGAEKRDYSFDQWPEVREVLERRLDRSVESSLTIRSIYGQYFPLLTSFDPRWAAAAVGAIFPEDDLELWWGAWTPYMQCGGAYDNVFNLLRRQYGIAVAKLPTEEAGEKRDGWVEHLGSHLMVFYWRGLIGLGEDDLVACFMQRASPQLRKQALEFVGRSLLNTAEAIPGEVLERLKALWESRVQVVRAASDREPYRIELTAFGAWFLSAKFDDAWSIDQLHQLMDVTEGDAIHAYPLIKRLTVLAPQMPDEAVQILERLLFGPKRNWQYVAGISEVGEILKMALGGSNAQAAQVAVRIVDKLAERGDMTYRPLVTQ